MYIHYIKKLYSVPTWRAYFLKKNFPANPVNKVLRTCINVVIIKIIDLPSISTGFYAYTVKVSLLI